MPPAPSNTNADAPGVLPEADVRRPSRGHDWGDLGKPGVDDDGFPRFPFASFHCPEPVAFPRHAFDEALRHHEALARAHMPGIEFVARRWAGFDDPTRLMDDWCVEMILDRGATTPRLDCFPRTTLARVYRRFFGLARRLVRWPGVDRMYLVQQASGTVTLSLLDARRETLSGGQVRSELVLEQPAVVFEPLRQHSMRDGSDWLVGWRATADGPLHVSRTRAERKASTPAAFIDHLFALHRDEVRALAWADRARGGLKDTYLMVTFNSIGGEHVMSSDRAPVHAIGMMERYPRIAAVLNAPWPSGWLPVFVDRARFAGIRWLPLRADASLGPRPEDVTEVKVKPALYVVE